METKPTPAACRQTAIVAVLTPAIRDALNRTIEATLNWIAQLQEEPNCTMESITNSAMLDSIQNTLAVVGQVRKAIKLAGRVLDGEA